MNVQYEQSNGEHFVGHSDGTKTLTAASYLITSHGWIHKVVPTNVLPISNDEMDAKDMTLK